MKIELTKRTVFQPIGLAIREAQDGEESRTIEGCAIVTGKETILYECGDYREVEVIDHACLNEEFLADQDIKLNMMHEREMTIARNNKGVGDLQYEVREDGLYFNVTLGKFDLADRALELVKSGVLSGCSFEFVPKDYDITERVGLDGKTEYVIRHTSFKSLSALTLAMDPAYKQTSVGVREAIEKEKEEMHQQIEEERKREEIDAAYAEREERDRRIAAIKRQQDLLELEYY